MNDLEIQATEARKIIQEWVDKRGHDNCWYYPDLFRRLVDVFGIEKPDIADQLNFSVALVAPLIVNQPKD
jgi:hypothetical protein